MGADQFIYVLRKNEVAHLRTGVDRIQLRAVERIPEPNRAICSSAAARQQSVLVRGPGQSLNCGGMLRKLVYGTRRVQVPNQKFIIVAARSEGLLVEGPFQAAHLLFVSCELADEGVGEAQIAV